MKKLMKKTIAAALCIIMAVSLCTPVFALEGKTDQYARKAAAVGISKAMGQIPVVGGVISPVIDTFLPDMLGVTGEHAEVMAKLEEINSAIRDLSLKMDDSQQKLFNEFYQQKIGSFNTDANRLKGTVNNLYSLVMEIESEYSDSGSRNEKQVQLASLIKSNDFGDPNSAVSQLLNLTDYVCGTQISNGREDGIFQLAYKANCRDSVLGCEAAIRSSGYVNDLSSYLETAYKTVFAIYAAKLYVCENCDEIAAEMADGLIAKCDLTDYTAYTGKIIKSTVFGSGSSSVLEYYKRLFDENRSDSAMNVYNDMIADNWFSYIDSTDYTAKPAKISYIPLDDEIGFLAPGEVVYDVGGVYKYDYAFGGEILKDMKGRSGMDRYVMAKAACGFVETKILELAHAALTPEQINRLMTHMANNPAYGTNDSELSFIQVLDDLGFSFDAYNSYIQSLPKQPAGMSYRDPSLPRAQTDGKRKIMPVSIENYHNGKWIDEGWYGSFAKGFCLQESANDNEQVTEEMARLCYEPYGKDDSLGDCYIDNTMILYFDKAGGSLIASVFGGRSAVTVPIICVGAAAIIAVPTVIILRNRKKKKTAEQ